VAGLTFHLWRLWLGEAQADVRQLKALLALLKKKSRW